MISHRETLDAAASALKDIAAKSSDPMASSLRKAAIALEKAEKRIDALEIVVRRLAKKEKYRANDVEFEKQATRQSWPRSELHDLLR
jgi:hypothetical protein